jgi:membrane-bound lytic murein transglycosylase B
MSIQKYSFSDAKQFASVQTTLLLAIWATESIYGEAVVRLDTSHVIDEAAWTVEIDRSTRVGWTLNKLFVGFLVREYGPGAFQVERRMEAVPA